MPREPTVPSTMRQHDRDLAIQAYWRATGRAKIAPAVAHVAQLAAEGDIFSQSLYLQRLQLKASSGHSND